MVSKICVTHRGHNNTTNIWWRCYDGIESYWCFQIYLHNIKTTSQIPVKSIYSFSKLHTHLQKHLHSNVLTRLSFRANLLDLLTTRSEPQFKWAIFKHSSSGFICLRDDKSMLVQLRPRQNGRRFPDDILKWIFLNENVWISIRISLNFVPKVLIHN